MSNILDGLWESDEKIVAISIDTKSGKLAILYDLLNYKSASSGFQPQIVGKKMNQILYTNAEKCEIERGFILRVYLNLF